MTDKNDVGDDKKTTSYHVHNNWTFIEFKTIIVDIEEVGSESHKKGFLARFADICKNVSIIVSLVSSLFTLCVIVAWVYIVLFGNPEQKALYADFKDILKSFK